MLCRLDSKYKTQYKVVKKEYDNLLQITRSERYQKRILTSDNKSKCMWAIYRENIGKEEHSDIGIGENIEQLPTLYNKFLLNKIPDIIKILNNVKTDVQINPNSRSMLLRPVSEAEVCGFATKMKNKYNAGVDEIPASIVKMTVPYICHVLSFLINNALEQDVFPGQLKTAVIRPIFKKGDPTILDNYRPISILPSFAKLFEMVMCDRLLHFMNRSNLIQPIQHAYLAGSSTYTAVFEFTRKIIPWKKAV